jgi:hypothetical protein
VGQHPVHAVYVLSGDALTRLRAGLLERALKEAPGEPDLEMPAPGSWPEPYRSRTGAFTQTIALAAQDRSLGTCIMAGVVRHPDLFRALIPESDDLVFAAAMPLGYSDWDAPINQFPRQRADLGERAFFVGS